MTELVFQLTYTQTVVNKLYPHCLMYIIHNTSFTCIHTYHSLVHTSFTCIHTYIIHLYTYIHHSLVYIHISFTCIPNTDTAFTCIHTPLNTAHKSECVQHIALNCTPQMHHMYVVCISMHSHCIPWYNTPLLYHPHTYTCSCVNRFITRPHKVNFLFLVCVQVNFLWATWLM